jgi:Ca2+-binding RTX toxin-like protein
MRDARESMLHVARSKGRGLEARSQEDGCQRRVGQSQWRNRLPRRLGWPVVAVWKGAEAMRRIVLVFGVVAALLLAGGAALAATFTGTDGHDRIVGTEEADTISVLGGNDRAIGRDGDDKISGGEGDDYLSGRGRIGCEEGESQEDDQDTVSGGAGKDLMIAGYGNGTLSGGEGDDSVFGNCADDLISGGDGDDFLGGWYGDDRMSGGEGDDDFEGWSNDDSISGGAGVDLVKGYYGDDTVSGGEQSDALGGEEGGDTLVGGGGADVLVAETGVDEVSGGAGDDYLLDGALYLETEEEEPNSVPYLFQLPPQLRDLSQRYNPYYPHVGTGWAFPVDVDASHDTFSGGDGADRFYVVNEGAGVRDTVSCGSGIDKVFADQKDSVTSDCEKVRRSESDAPSRTADGTKATMKRF